MAEEITLSAYIGRIENMIRQGRMDEAIAHSAHVLQFYPKNAVLYRNLGRALMRQQRYDEAGEVFRRLLAAVPDDFSAHYQLSIVYEQEQNVDATLWHIERAFDQQPNNEQVNDRLRELYLKFRQVEVDKIQLTAGAVANQYLKAKLFDEALDLLERTLARLPDRVDLRLIKARALWQKGDVIDAAETALDIIASYPFALEPNRILCELWLMEERPSDAQRYLSRVEDIDPFLAYEIATDEELDEARFMVPELDFSRYAASLASREQAPDWLSNIDELAEAQELATEEDFIDDEALATEIESNDEDWLREIQDAQPTPTPAKKVTDDLSDLLPDDFNFPDSAGTDDTVADDAIDFSIFDEDNDNLLTDITTDDLFDNKPVTDSLTDPDADDSAVGLLGKLAGKKDEKRGETDDLSWLDDVAAGHYDDDKQADDDELSDLFGEISIDDDFDVERALPAIDPNKPETDPLAWLGEDNLIDGQAGPEDDDPLGTDDLDKPKQEINPDDPMAWLQQSGIEFEDTAEGTRPRYEDNDPVSIESDDVDPLAWLGGMSEEEITEQRYMPTNMLDLEDVESLELDDDSVQEADPLAWLEEEGIEVTRTDEFEAVDTDNLDLDTNAFDEGDDDDMAWLNDADIDLEDEPSPVQTSDVNQILTDQLEQLDESAQEIEGDPLAWLAEDGVEFIDHEDEGEALDDDDWLADDSVLDDLLNIADLTNTSSAEPLDTGLLEDYSAEADEQPAWDDTPADAMESDEDALAWLDESSLDLDDPDELDELTSSMEDDDSMAWLADSNLLDDADVHDDDIGTRVTDQLGELEPEPEDVIEADNETDDEPEETVSRSAGMLNFLSAGDESGDLPELDDLDTYEDEQEADWLQALDGNDNADSDGFEWGFGDTQDATPDDALDWTDESGIDDFTDFGDDDAQAMGADWLADMNDKQPSDEFNDFDDFDFNEDNDAQPADADWLNELESEGDDFDFTDDSAEPQPADADWLNELESEGDDFDFTDDSAEPQPADADWLDELESEGDDFDFTDDSDEPQPADADWLNELESEGDDFDFTDDSDEPQPADADWLDELESEGDDFDFTDDSDEPQPADADWLDELESEGDDFDFTDDSAEPQPADADWLNEVEEGGEMEWGEVGQGFTDELEDDEPQSQEDWDAVEVGQGFTDELDEETPDWLTEATANIETDADMEVDISEEEFEEPAEWLNALNEDEIAVQESEEWGVLGKGFTDELEDDEPQSQEDWDAVEVGQGFTDELDEESGEDASSSDDWLEDIAYEEELDWSDEDYEDYEEYDLNVSTEGMTDMLETIRSAQSTPIEETLDDLDVDEPDWLKDTDSLSDSDVEEPAEPSWLAGMEAELDETVDEFESEADALSELDETLDEFEQEFEEDDIVASEDEEALPLGEIDYSEPEIEAVAASIDENYEEETDQSAADNAPDWLNAMVPGLDLDFEAEDEGHLDEGFEEHETLRERKINESEIIDSDFEWLQDIVEEESGMMEPISVEEDSSTPPPPPIGLPQRRVYEFSDLPVWARDEGIQNLALMDNTDQAVPDYLSDFEDFEDAPDYDLSDEFEDNFQFDTDEMAVQDSEFLLQDDQATTPNPSVTIEDDTFAHADEEIDIASNFDDEFDDEFEDFDEFDDFDDDFDDEFDDDPDKDTI